MKKINVSAEACIGCGACVAIDPEHFAFNDEGLSHPLNNENLESKELANAIDSCPTSAISIKDEDETCECGCGENCNCTEESNCGCHCWEKEDKESCECNPTCECDNCHCQEE